MTRKPNIALRRRAKQQRAIATVEAIVEAAIYILAHRGPSAFTTNRVAEKAGVNVASLYQYFPNKEALLFHIVQLTWERQVARLAPLLTRPGSDYASKLRDFLREFFTIEAAEADLRRALRAASVELRFTAEFRQLIAQGTDLARAFLGEAMSAQDGDGLEFNVRFMVLLTTSFAERTTDERTPRAELLRQADMLSGMLINHFGLA